MLFICDFCQNQTQLLIKVPCLTFIPEERSFSFARIIDSEANTMNICSECLRVENNKRS